MKERLVKALALLEGVALRFVEEPIELTLAIDHLNTLIDRWDTVIAK